MGEKVVMQIGYTPNADEVTDRALMMLSSADRKKSMLIALALNEFQEKYGFRIDSKEEIHAVLSSYEYLRRTTTEKNHAPYETEPAEIVFERKKTVKKDRSTATIEEAEIKENSSAENSQNDVSDLSEQLKDSEEATDSQKALMNDIMALFNS